MELVVVALVVLGLLVVANLLLTGAVVRRLAAHERKFATLGSAYPAPGGLAAGSKVPAFAAETTDGRTVDAGFLGDKPGVIGFFSTTCPGCLEQAPEFADAVASGTPGFAVVSGEGGAELLSMLESVPVVREPDSGGPIGAGFEVDTFPSFFVVEGDMVVSAVLSTAEAKELVAK
ncbi:TlpA family protein disulfide reductase [Pseudonocardia sichuanensis]|uniref:AhpC/TSA family protein n=1 Tax=Pseudonocardia kunmingensis TaxID=630975 RepID=A0A543E3L6_9PSEU|nr:redoxin domain-containing protein [Pseudonocardia kunmingensis]TQM16162.1 AhpC/TSA family protein [Pseudonocardia kunmingensis]